MQTGTKGLRGTDTSSSKLEPNAADKSPSGFAGRLEGATVADLIQLECTSGRTRAIRVQSRGRTGYLCFERGTLAHAIAPGAVGDAAVLQILSWQDGAFEPARVHWPATPTVRSSWQHLALTAAHVADEAARGKVVEFRTELRKGAAADDVIDQPVSQVVDQVPTTEHSSAEAVQLVERMQDDSLELGLNEPAPLRRLVTQAVRLDASGRVLAARGEVEKFSGVTAYGKRLGDLIGEALGAGKLHALKCTTGQTQTLVYTEESGTTVGIRAAPNSNLAVLDGKLGL